MFSMAVLIFSSKRDWAPTEWMPHAYNPFVSNVCIRAYVRFSLLWQ